MILFVGVLACGNDKGKAPEKTREFDAGKATETVEVIDAGVVKTAPPVDAGRRIDIEIPVLE